MEGKEARFGIAASTLFAAITTAASCGAVNAMHDSFMPLGGAVPLVLIQLGEVVFGGVGSGLYGMLVFAVLTVFIAGLMIGRTPEYLGKKIETYDMKMVSIAILATPILVLVGTAIAVAAEAGRAGIANPGAHGFTEILYAFSSAANNNGSAFAGLSANTPFYNTSSRVAMWFGRFAVIVPVLALAGSLAAKKRLPRDRPDPAHPRSAVRRASDRQRRPGRPAELRAGARARADRRALLALRRQVSDMSTTTRISFSLFDPALRPAGDRRVFRQARPADPVAQPGDVRRLRRQHPHDRARLAGARPATAKRRPDSSSPSPSGSGSRCCSPTSPRRSPKAAARPRPPACAA